MRVFLSHASADKPQARRIAASLKRSGIDVWLDEAEIRVGHSIPDMIAEGIAGSQLCCILISKNSNASKWVSREYNAFLPRALSGLADILPCRLDNSTIPVLLGDIKYAEFSGSFARGMKELKGAVRLREAVEQFKRVDDEARWLLRTVGKEDMKYLLRDVIERTVLVHQHAYPSVLALLEQRKLLESEQEPRGGPRVFFVNDFGKLVLKRLAELHLP